MKRIVRNTLFFIGWVLSPLTFWNDVFVNIPLSYLLANLLARIIRADFLWLVLVSYWLTNVLGLGLMYAAGKDALRGREGALKELLKLIGTTAIYSIIIVALIRSGILKPL